MEGSSVAQKCLRAEEYAGKIVDVAARAQLCEELKTLRAQSQGLETSMIAAAKECRTLHDQSVDEMYRDIWEEQRSDTVESLLPVDRQKEAFLSSLISKLKGVSDEHKGSANNIVSIVGDNSASASSATPMPVVVSKHFSPPKSSPTGVSRGRGGDKVKKASPTATVWGNDTVLTSGEGTEGRRHLQFDESERTQPSALPPSEAVIEASSSLTPVPKPAAATGFTENMTSTLKRNRCGVSVSDKSEDLMHGHDEHNFSVSEGGYEDTAGTTGSKSSSSSSSKQRRTSHDRRRDTLHQSQPDIGQTKELFCGPTQQY